MGVVVVITLWGVLNSGLLRTNYKSNLLRPPSLRLRLVGASCRLELHAFADHPARTCPPCITNSISLKRNALMGWLSIVDVVVGTSGVGWHFGWSLHPSDLLVLTYMQINFLRYKLF